MSIGITGTGSYLPERVLTNADLEKIVETSDEWIVTRTGIRERRIARVDETTSEMAGRAAVQALAAADMAAAQLDMIVVATATPDTNFPSVSCLVQAAIGANKAFCFDVQAACSGFLYALETARNFLASGTVSSALVIGAEKFSAITDWSDRDTCVLFGDGAGAAVVRRVDSGRGIVATVMGSDGTLGELLKTTPCGARAPATDKNTGCELPRIVMNGREVFKNAVRCMSDTACDVLEKAGLETKDVDLVIPHQANMRIMNAIASRLRLPIDRFYLNLERVGNISAASVPVAMDDAAREGRLKKGDIVLLVSFGAGFTWGAMVMEW